MSHSLGWCKGALLQLSILFIYYTIDLIQFNMHFKNVFIETNK